MLLSRSDHHSRRYCRIDDSYTSTDSTIITDSAVAYYGRIRKDMNIRSNYWVMTLCVAADGAALMYHEPVGVGGPSQYCSYRVRKQKDRGELHLVEYVYRMKELVEQIETFGQVDVVESPCLTAAHVEKH